MFEFDSILLVYSNLETITEGNWHNHYKMHCMIGFSGHPNEQNAFSHLKWHYKRRMRSVFVFAPSRTYNIYTRHQKTQIHVCRKSKALPNTSHFFVNRNSLQQCTSYSSNKPHPISCKMQIYKIPKCKPINIDKNIIMAEEGPEQKQKYSVHVRMLYEKKDLFAFVQC